MHEPQQVTGRGGGRSWLRRLLDFGRQLEEDDIPIVAAGLAFFALLSGTPLLAALIGLYGLVTAPQLAEQKLSRLMEFLPRDAQQLVAQQVHDIVSTSPSALGIGSAIGIVSALWVGSKGVFYLFRALNLAYGVEESRGYLRLKLTAFACTVGLVLTGVVALLLVAVLPAVGEMLGLADRSEHLLTVGRWLFLYVAALAGFEALYRFGPSRSPARGRPVTLGAVAASAAWILASLGFFAVLELSDKFTRQYGSLASVIAVLVWLFLTAFIVLAGAELTARSAERRERRSG